MLIKKIAFATAVVFLVTLTSRAQDSCQRYVETAGGFSICIPAGWEVQEKEGQKFKLLFGARGQYLTSNINFKDENNSTLINDYATAAVAHILKNYRDTGADSVKLVSQEPFTTASGVSGVRVAFSSEFNGLLVR